MLQNNVMQPAFPLQDTLAPVAKVGVQKENRRQYQLSHSMLRDKETHIGNHKMSNGESQCEGSPKGHHEPRAPTLGDLDRSTGKAFVLMMQWTWRSLG
ncbi:hypothetical protein ACSBR1_028147 [Camellia fascicularis]